MKIVCVIQTMRMGGAQRVFALMADYWIQNGVEVTLILFSNEDEVSFVPFHELVKTRKLGILGNVEGGVFSKIVKNLNRFPILRKAIISESPDCVLGFMVDENMVTRISTFGLNIPVVLVEHSPFHFEIGRVKEFLRNILYPTADQIVCLTQRAKQAFVKPISQKTKAIYNPVSLGDLIFEENPEKRAVNNTEKGRIVALGRLAKQKRFDRLIHAFSIVHKRKSKWLLTIIGEGDEREFLEQTIRELSLDDVVDIPGGHPQPWAQLRKGDFFVMSSDSEGFPMVLLEAMSLGMPVVSTDCETGPSEIIENETNGLLVDCDEKSLADAMIKLIENPQLRLKLGLNAIEVREAFSVDSIMKKYDRVIANVINLRKLKQV